MARAFNDSASEYLGCAAPLTACPFAVAGWLRTDDVAANQTAWSLNLSSSNAHQICLLLRGASAGDPLSFDMRAGGGFASATTSNGLSLNTWHHGVGLAVAAADRRSILDGVIASKGTDSTSLGMPTCDTMEFAALGDSSRSAYWSGQLAEFALWDLSDWPGATDSDKADEFERLAVPALAAGYSPLLFPLGLTGYWPLGGVYDADDGDHDVVGGYDMSPQNTPTVADHVPGMIYPASVDDWVLTLVAGPPAAQIAAAIQPVFYLPRRPPLVAVPY